MANLFDDFDLDIQKEPTEPEPAAPVGTTVGITFTLRSYWYSCPLTCIEVGKTSDLCNSDNCSALTYCRDC